MAIKNEEFVEEVVERRATYVGLSGTFLALFAAFTWRERREHEELHLRPLDVVLLAFSTYRLGRMIAYDKVMEAYRAPFAKTVPDVTGAGESVVPKGRGVRRAIGELITCPICSGTWVAAALVYGLGVAPGPTRAFLTIMSSIGMGEFLNAATEALQWTGQARRKEAGS